VFEKIISKNPDEDSPAPKPHSAPTPKPASKSDLSQAPKSPAPSSGQRNVLLPDVEIKGKVRFENDLIVDGRIEGEITSDGSLTVGENATIKAEIKTKTVVVYGKVHGNITVTDRLELRANAEVVGDIKAAILAMDAGAIFVGNSAVGKPSSPDAAPASKPAAAPVSSKPDSPQSGGKDMGPGAKPASSTASTP